MSLSIETALWTNRLLCLENTIGDIVLLTTFPAKIEDVSAYYAINTKSDLLLFSTSREGLGFPYVLPLRYEFRKKEDYKQYGRVLLPYSPVISNL